MKEQKLITAEAMAKAVQFDPQFVVPDRPRFLRELVVVPLTDGILVDGTDEQQVLRGQATNSLLPLLLPLLDGSRTLEQIATSLSNIPIDAIRNAIALLYTRGLLEDSTADLDIDPSSFDPQALAFFRRHVDATRVNRSALQSLARLADFQVIVFANGPNCEMARTLIATALRQTGISKIGCADLGVELSTVFEEDDKQSGKLAVVLVEGEDPESQLQEIDEQCAKLRIPWLRGSISLASVRADLGPYFERGETACYSCFSKTNFQEERIAATQRMADSDVVDIDRSGTESTLQLASWSARLWANMLALEVIYLISRIAPLATGLNVTRYDLVDWSTNWLRFPKLPGCSNCRPVQMPNTDTSLARPIETAIVYEDAISFPSRHLLDPKSHQVHYQVSNLELTLEGKRYSNVERVNLPDRTQLPHPQGVTLDHLLGIANKPPIEPLNLCNIASLLMLSAGIRYNNGSKAIKLQRWAPTGGNLGSVELYVAANNVDGLEPGYYFYQAHEHLLARINYTKRPDEIVDFIQQATPLECSAMAVPDALIIVVAALHRVFRKYGAFAYRVVNLDAGVALGQLHMVGGSLGLSSSTVHRWADDVIAERLGLDATAEYVMAVSAVNGSQSHCLPKQED